MVDISFNANTIEILKGLVGKRFDHYSCDPFVFSSSVFGIVGFKIGDCDYKLTCNLKKTERFFSEDEIAVLDFSNCSNEIIKSRMDNGTMVDTPVQDVIDSIEIINDCESVSHENETKVLYSTKGIIFHFSQGNELSFEVDTWFSEMITVQRGYNLIESFTPINDFYEEWEETGYIPSAERKTIIIS